MMLANLTLAAIAWEPTIRGMLAVAIIFVVLCGSVYLLLATNTGVRTGFLLAITGFFGWMALMGIVWTIYGIGWVGQDPHWRFQEVDWNGGQTAYTEIVSDDPSFASWHPVPQEDPAFGELQAVAGEELTHGNPAPYNSETDFIILDVYQKGGKPRRANDSMVERVTNRITNTLRVTHPPHYAVVLVQGIIDKGPVEPGQAPHIPEADPDQPVVALIVLRDLGNLRLTPAALTFFSFVVFGIGANALHRRDKLIEANRASKTPVTA